MKPSDASIAAALAQVRAATWTPETIILAEQTAREAGIDVDQGLAEGWIVRLEEPPAE